MSRVCRLSEPRILRRALVRQAHRVAGQRPELAEDRRLLHEGDAERHERPVLQRLLSELILLIILRQRPEERVVVAAAL